MISEQELLERLDKELAVERWLLEAGCGVESYRHGRIDAYLAVKRILQEHAGQPEPYASIKTV